MKLFNRRMSFEDFSKQFTHLDLVHIGPDDWMNEPALHSKKPWRAVLARRRWRAGYNAGGGPLHLGMQLALSSGCDDPQCPCRNISFPRKSCNRKETTPLPRIL